MSSAAPSRGLAASSLANTVHDIARQRHASEDPQHSSTESFSTLEDDSSDDEIVYSISDLSIVSAPRSDGFSSEDDYVLLGRGDSPSGLQSVPSGFTSLSASMIQSQVGSTPNERLSDAFSHLQVEDSDSDSVRPASQATTRRRRRRNTHPVASSSAQPPATGASMKKSASTSATPKKAVSASPQSAPTTPSKKAAKRARKKAKKAKAAAKAAQAAAQSAQASEKVATQGGEAKASGDFTASAIMSASFYQEAVSYISTFLSSPTEQSKGQSNLTLLQALIIELGLCPATASDNSEASFAHISSLPRSLRAAKALLKSRVFVNVRDYLDVRHKGLVALQSVMHPTRKALVQDLSRGKGKRRVPRDIVKESGLGVLLVTCCH